MDVNKKKPKRKTGRASTYRTGTIDEAPFEKGHSEKLVHYMEQGLFDYEIMSLLKICRATFYIWIKEHEDFGKAHEMGKASRFHWWLTEGKKRFSEGNDKGYKFWVTIMNNMFSDVGWVSEYAKTHGQTININNMSVIQQTPKELLENIKANFNQLFDHTKVDIIDAIPEIKELTDGSDETKTT